MKIAIMTSFPAKGNVYVDAGHGCKHREKAEAMLRPAHAHPRATAQQPAKAKAEEEL